MTPRQTVGHDANDRRNPLAEVFALLLLTSAVVVVVLVVASGFSGG